MKLPLLEQTQQLPESVPMRTRLGATGVSGADFQISTSGLPRRLPDAYLPSDYGQAPLEAQTRLAATGATLATTAENLLLEAGVRVRDANNVARVSTLFTDAAEASDNALAKRQVSEDHSSFKPAYEQDWTAIATGAMNLAANPEQRQLLGQKLAAFRVAQNREVNTIQRGKLTHYWDAALDENTARTVDLASKAANTEELQVYVNTLETDLQAAVRSGTQPADKIVDVRQKAIREINVNRSRDLAYSEPLSVLQAIDRGDYDQTLKAHDRLALAEFADGRLRTLRRDEESAAARERAAVKAQQDTNANDALAQIVTNFAPGGPGLDMSMTLTEHRRDYGEHYDNLLTTNRLYVERQQNPKPSKGDPVLAGQIETAYREGRFQDYTYQSLNRLLENDQLNSPQFQHLAALRDSELKQRQHDAETLTDAQKQAKKDREEQITTGKQTIHAFIVEHGPFTDPTVSDTIAAESVGDFLRRTNDPNADVNEELSQVIGRGVVRLNMLGKQRTYPYTTKEQVQDAYKAHLIDGNTAKIYYRIFDFQQQYVTPKTTTAPAETPKPGILERAKQKLGITPEPESPTPAQRKP